jgi:S1-C subfamily serine protease
MTGLDWAIVAFAVLMGLWGYQQGLIVGALSLIGFLVGAILGSRIGPALLAEGSESPYAPATALAGALLIGGIVALALEGLAFKARRRLIGRAGRKPGVKVAEAIAGSALLVVVALALAWMFGAVALNAPGAKDLRRAVQRSVILQELNGALPPTGSLLNAFNRIDPGRAIEGPDPNVAAPDARIANDPEVRGATGSVVRVLGTACGLAVSGSGWYASPNLVVTNAHVVAGSEDTTVTLGDDDEHHDATPVHYEPANDIAILRVDEVASPLPLAEQVESETPGAVIGYPENEGLTVTAARAGTTEKVISEDSYGRGPIERELTALRGEVRSGNSGGPLVDGEGRVLTTVFASTLSGRAGGYGIPNDVVGDALAGAGGEVGTGPCTH